MSTTPTTAANDSLLDHREAAALMRCSVVTVRRLRYRGELPTTRVGSKVLIPRQAIEDYLASHTTTEPVR